MVTIEHTHPTPVRECLQRRTQDKRRIGPKSARRCRTANVATAKTLHERGVPFIDVYKLWPQGHIPGAHFLELWTEEFNEVRLAEIAGKSQELVIYSSSAGGEGRQAADACAKAATWGYKKIYFFRDGFPGWQSAGYPIDAASG